MSNSNRDLTALKDVTSRNAIKRIATTKTDTNATDAGTNGDKKTITVPVTHIPDILALRVRDADATNFLGSLI